MERLSCPASTGQSRDWTASLCHAKPLLSPASQALSKGLSPEAPGGSQSLVSSIVLMLHKGLNSSKQLRIKPSGVSLLDLMPGTNLANNTLRRPLQRSEGGAEPHSPGAAGWQSQGCALLRLLQEESTRLLSPQPRQASASLKST